MRRQLAAILVVGLLGGCEGTQSVVGGPAYGEDPANPVICVGDPDTGMICQRASDFWDCTLMPNGDKKCVHKEPQKPGSTPPGGTATWTCVAQGTNIVCTTPTKDAPVPGGSGWNCTTSEQGTSCTKEAPVPPGGGTIIPPGTTPPPGGSGWTCTLQEFTWTCVQKAPPPGTTPPPTTTPPSTTPPLPPGAMPPGPGVEQCVTGGSTPEHGVAPAGAWAKIVTKKVLLNGVEALYARVTFNTAFVDNCYGKNTTPYYNPTGKQIGHTFDQLVESDKADIYINDGSGKLAMQMSVDYISPSPAAPSGYACLGVKGGEGAMAIGNAADVLAARSSLAVNLNELGYKLLVDSPICKYPDYPPDPAYPNWIFPVWYEVWVRWAAFSGGVSKVYITGIHASPSRVGANSFDVNPMPCPP